MPQPAALRTIYTKSVAWGIFGIVLVLAGSFVIWSGVRSRADLAASRTWLTAPGRVLTSDLQSTINSRRTVYLPKVEYEYTVAGGHTYRSSRVNLGSRWSDLAAAQAVVARYPAQAAVQVFYNPSQPAEAVLERDEKSSMIAIWWGITVIGIGLILVVNWLLLTPVVNKP